MAYQAEFKVLNDKDSKYYWHLEAANGQLVAWSGQVYASKQSCVDELYWIRDNTARIPVGDYTR